MIIDNYLEEFQFSEYHSKEVNAGAEEIYRHIKTVDFCKSKIIKSLLFLRGLSANMCNINEFIEKGFILLEEDEPEEIVLGFIAKSGKITLIPASRFKEFNEADCIKGVWNFHLSPIGSSKANVSTETRVFCTSRKSRLIFSIYWFFIRPFSGLIRRIMLKLIKQEIEKTNEYY